MGGCSTKPKTAEFEGSMDQTFEGTIDEKGYSLQTLLLEQATKLPFTGFTRENENEEKLTPFLGKNMDGLVPQKEALLFEAKKETIEFLKERLVASQEKLVACQEKIFQESVGTDLLQKIGEAEMNQNIPKEVRFQQNVKEARFEQKIEETSLEHSLKASIPEHNFDAERNCGETARTVGNLHSNVKPVQERNMANAVEIQLNGGRVKKGIEGRQDIISVSSYAGEEYSSPRHKCASDANEGAHQECPMASAHKFESVDSRRDRWTHIIGKFEQDMQIRSPRHTKLCQEDKTLASIERIEPLASTIGLLAPDIDEVFDKLASEFERQESLSSSCRS